MRNNYLLSSLVWLAVINFASSQICTVKAVKTVTHTEMRTHTFMDSRLVPCHNGESCIDFFTNSYETPVKISEHKDTIVQKCCTGYIQDVESESLICKPICKVHCENGYCSEPNVCTCYEGFGKKAVWYGTVCKPLCKNDCINGKCVSPDNCECNHGYIATNTTCQPVCSSPCVNGLCNAPETCECLPGFRLSNTNTCEPYCSTGCENGDCVGPETCECQSGFYKVNNTLNVETCMPVCDENCYNGSCLAPNNCICKPGYFKSGNNTCVIDLFNSNEESVYGYWPKAVEPNEVLLTTTSPVTPTNASDINTTASLYTSSELSNTESTLADSTVALTTANNNADVSLYVTTLSEKTDYSLIYVLVGAAIVLTVVSIILVIIYRKKILTYFKGSEYYIEDVHKQDLPEEFLNVTFSSVHKENN